MLIFLHLNNKRMFYLPLSVYRLKRKLEFSLNILQIYSRLKTRKDLRISISFKLLFLNTFLLLPFLLEISNWLMGFMGKIWLW